MAHTKSAIKRIKQDAGRKLRNSAVKKHVKSARTRLTKALEAKDAEAIKKAYTEVCSTLDKAAKKGTIKRETANRSKARAGKAMRVALAS